jgi:hypothetical protein
VVWEPGEPPAHPAQHRRGRRCSEHHSRPAPAGRHEDSTITTANDQIARTITLPLGQGTSTAKAGTGMRVRLIAAAVASVTAVLAFAAAAQASLFGWDRR